MSRKLQAEIERVFKKVAEGIEEFEDCYDKVLNASNASQKEKYETDLKKEIKKLQRLRDQIKTWIQSNEIKDKQDLLHHRKLIEKQMEKFKAIEKEMKTKAYSKEGLLQSTRLDPKEKEKLDLCNWLVESVDSLSTQIDVLEATAETIEGSMGKKRRDPNKVEKLGALHERVERHKFHIRCLERIQRLLENESLSTEQVQQIQEDVNYYVEQNSDEEFVEDEFIYDELPLDEDDALFAIPGEDDAFNIDGDGSSAKPPQEQQALENESHSTTGKAMPEPEAQRDSISIATSTSADVATTAKPTISRASASPVGTKRPSGDEQQQQQPAMQRPKYFTLFQDSEVPDAFADLMATFMKAKHRFSAKQENVHNLQRQMVDMSLQGIPSLLDQERPKAARQTQVNTPSYYPQTALPVIEHPGMAAHLDLDTLFFAFYYQPNTYQQYLAAKELNRQSWRFHKKYLTWFQRYEEPSDITDDYEQGTYIYFDYEGAWCQRKKSEFRFGYQFLEDTELA
ncbi:general negative regulator of transcription subunit 5 [Coemansia spiralis]|uniref:General negative regulator of transcription subunit 5 n=1 Tax=Coemansia spiralis TaxID=417178 RepID=A0A9W8GAN2_9FUNG|nr:Not1 N-terminal domain, CCR4-Not complex component-domain-containing protein [Coemansia spiralis]KAJ2678359.1 general negative regulator of transcription subunit 5 [Coemansia spiralis]